jgi:hypothetical protein
MSVIEYHRQHSDSAQPVNIIAMPQRSPQLKNIAA